MIVQKEAISVAEMSRLVGLSRQRFYQLVGSAFPPPVYDVASRRPFYTRELQEICLDVRRRQCGINGRPVLFHARSNIVTPTRTSRPRTKVSRAKADGNADLVEGLMALGLIDVTPAQAAEAVKVLYPSGLEGVDQGEVLRTVFLHLKAPG